MKNHTSIKTATGEVALTYGLYATKQFCTRMEVDPAPMLVLSLFQGRKLYDALAALILAGAEHAAMSAKQPFTLTEFDALELAEELNDEQTQNLMHCFIGSLIDKRPEEVDAWLKAVTQAAEEAAKAPAEKEGQEANPEEKAQPQEVAVS